MHVNGNHDNIMFLYYNKKSLVLGFNIMVSRYRYYNIAQVTGQGEILASQEFDCSHRLTYSVCTL